MPIGPWELLIILFFVLLFFGARKLPEMGRALGIGMRGFKEEVAGDRQEESPDERSLPAAERPVEAEPATGRARARESG